MTERERMTITPIDPEYVDERMRQLQAMAERSASAGPPQRSGTERRAQGSPEKFRRHEIPPDVPRGLFTLFIEDGKGQHVAQVWAATPSSAASLMAPWAKDRLRRARKRSEVPVELVGWDDTEEAGDLSAKSGIPEDELDPGISLGVELFHVWIAEHEEAGKKWSLYVIETIPYDLGVVDEPWM